MERILEKNLARKGFISRDSFSFFFFSRVYFELEVYTLSGVYLIIFLFSFFRIFTSFIVVSSLSLSWLLGIEEFRKSLLFS